MMETQISSSDSWRMKDQLDATFYFISLIMRSTCFGHYYIHLQELATLLMSYHIGRLVLSSLCIGAFVAAGIWWCLFCRLQPTKRTPPNTNRNKSSNAQRTENNMTDVVTHQHSRKLLKMDIVRSDTCWAHNKWNKIASDIKLVFHSSTIAMMHGPINIRFVIRVVKGKRPGEKWSRCRRQSVIINPY